MTHDEANKWAIKCLSTLLQHKLLSLTLSEATHHAMAMTLLTGTVWRISPAENKHGISWRVRDTGQSPHVPSNDNRAGSF